MDIRGLTWLTPLQAPCAAKGRRGRPRKLNAAVRGLILQMREDHTIRDIANILHLSIDTVSEYLNRSKRGG